MSSPAPSAPPFPLVTRRRLLGWGVGTAQSARRGLGTDVAGSRPYRPGDDVHAIDWAASARLSSARGVPEFVVREYYAEEAPRVVLVRDRRPEMALYGRELPWLRKDAAVETAARLVQATALAEHAALGSLEEDGGEPRWRAPRASRRGEEAEPPPAFAARPGTLARALELLLHVRPRLPLGTFVFLLSDFLDPPPAEAWVAALERGWELVPVVVQDPVWERSFPDVRGLVVRFSDPATGRARLVRISRGDAARRRAEHERRYAGLVQELRGLGVEPVEVATNDENEILAAFLQWAQTRLDERRRGW